MKSSLIEIKVRNGLFVIVDDYKTCSFGDIKQFRQFQIMQHFHVGESPRQNYGGVMHYWWDVHVFHLFKYMFHYQYEKLKQMGSVYFAHNDFRWQTSFMVCLLNSMKILYLIWQTSHPIAFVNNVFVSNSWQLHKILMNKFSSKLTSYL